MPFDEECNLIAHYESPYHRGRLPDPTIFHELRNPTCGDWIRLELRFERTRWVELAYFEGGGCVLSQSAASMLCEYIEGHTIGELLNFTSDEMVTLIGINISPGRLHCALLAFRALKLILCLQNGSDTSG